MDPGTTGQLIALFILLCLSAFFSSSETALMSVNRIRLRQMIEEKRKGAYIVDRLIENPSRLLSVILVGNNVVNIGASALATSLAIDYFGNKGVGIATGVMTFLVLVFGEITPKSLAAENAERVALLVARPIDLLSRILRPVVALLLWFTNSIIRIFGGKIDEKEPLITEDELKTMVSVSHEEGVLELDERLMIENVFDFDDSLVKDVMTPRTDMIDADVESTYEELRTLFIEKQVSRIPIYVDNNDNILGILSVKDFIRIDPEDDNFVLAQYLIEPYYVFESQRNAVLFERMRLAQASMAIVVDEYGGTAGLVTMEDLVEEIVGDIDDEHDEPIEEIRALNGHNFLVHGATSIDDVNEALDLDISSEDFETIGGFILGEIERIPNVGERIYVGPLTFTVKKMQRHRIEELHLHNPAVTKKH